MMSDRTHSEATEIHTRILRLALGIEESRAYWANVDVGVPLLQRPVTAFERRWFGAKSLARVRTLLGNFVARYDAYPEAFAVLRRWPDMDPPTRRVLCHFHLQLADPIYRDFTGRFLVERRAAAKPEVDRAAVLRWVQTTYPDRWSAATCVQFASKLLSAALEAGLVTARDPRGLIYPPVSDQALGYLLYLLRHLRFEGTLLDNPYVASVGLTESFLESRLRSTPGLSFHRMADLTDFVWAAPDIASWASLVFGGSAP